MIDIIKLTKEYYSKTGDLEESSYKLLKLMKKDDFNRNTITHLLLEYVHFTLKRKKSA